MRQALIDYQFYERWLRALRPSLPPTTALQILGMKPIPRPRPKTRAQQSLKSNGDQATSCAKGRGGFPNLGTL